MSRAPTRTSNRPNRRSDHQGPGPADPSDPSSPRGPCSCARADLHARLLPHLASESRVEAVVLHRRARPVSPDPSRKLSAPPPRDTKRRRNGPAPGSPRTAIARSSPSSRPRPRTPPACTTTPAPPRSWRSDRAASRSARPRRPRPRRGRSVDTTRTPQNPRKPWEQAESGYLTTGNIGIDGTRTPSTTRSSADRQLRVSPPLDRRGVAPPVVVTVGPKHPLWFGGVYEQPRAARWIHGPAFARPRVRPGRRLRSRSAASLSRAERSLRSDRTGPASRRLRNSARRRPV